jgi:soluble lytic murein transglycosylase-like protein
LKKDEKMTLAMMLILAALAAPSDPLLDAIKQVESSGNAKAIGDGGKAVGAYQIHAAVITNVNRKYGTKYTLKDRTDPHKSRQICKLYLTMYGKGLSQIELARVWNGGPKGHKKTATLGYAKKIERAMK